MKAFSEIVSNNKLLSKYMCKACWVLIVKCEKQTVPWYITSKHDR